MLHYMCFKLTHVYFHIPFSSFFKKRPRRKSSTAERESKRKENCKKEKEKSIAFDALYHSNNIHLKNTPQPLNIIQTDISKNVYNVRTHQQNSILGIQNKKTFLYT